MQGHYSAVDYNNKFYFKMMLWCWHRGLRRACTLRQCVIYFTTTHGPYTSHDMTVEYEYMKGYYLLCLVCQPGLMATYQVNSDWIDNTAFIVQTIGLFLTTDCAADRMTRGNLFANTSDALFEVLTYNRIICSTYLVLEATGCRLLLQLYGKKC
jgi:hypothetical protein